MNKGAKVLLIIMLAVISVYVIIGLNDNANGDNINEQNPSGDMNEVITSGEVSGDDYISDIEYELTSGENEVVLSARTTGDIGKTRYIFENEKLVKIIVTEEILSGDFVEEVYNSMKEDTTFSQIYSTITLEGNIITLELKEEIVNAYSGKSKADLYEELANSMKNSM